jgi:hypothetical protein
MCEEGAIHLVCINQSLKFVMGVLYIRIVASLHVSVARRAMFDNLHLSAQQGFTPVIARAKFQDRVNEHEHALEFRSNKPPNYNEEVK